MADEVLATWTLRGGPPPALLARLDEVCDRFEDDLQAGHTPRIEDHLAAVGAAERPALLRELLRLELHYRRLRGDTLGPEEYRRRFPAHEEVLAGLFALDAGSVRADEGPAPGWVRPRGLDSSSVPGYEVLGELGRGGMGIVYKARQAALGRVVALKVVQPGAHVQEQALARFRAEAQAVARVQHPNIVQIYEVGEHQGLPYFSLEFCPGGSLDRQLDGTPWLGRRAARLVESLARAVQAAHDRGVVHRDLKPGNILLAEDGTPKISDFGLARRLDEAALTGTSEVLGTPCYMAPEQAVGRAREVGPAADVYALGALLYTCLTGGPPFRAPTALETMYQVVHDEPVPPRRLQPGVARDLETICLKCLHKEPHHRYASATALAEDLRCFRAGEPILARPVSRLERAGKWMRRHPALAVAYGLLVLLLVVGVGGGSAVWLWRQAQAGWDEATQALARAEKARGETEAARHQEARARTQVERTNQRLKRVEYLARMEQAQREWLAGRVARAIQLLDNYPAERHQWEWRYLNHLCRSGRTVLRGHTGAVLAVCFDPEGKRLVSGSEDKTVRLWNAADGKPLTGLHGHQGPVTAVAWSPEGHEFASASQDRTVRLWNAQNRQHLRTLKAGAAVLSLAYSPQGGQLAAGLADGQISFWDISFREKRLILSGENPSASIAFSRSGKELVCAQRDRVVVYDLIRRRRVASFPSRPGDAGSCHAVAFNFENTRLATAWEDAAVRLWGVGGASKPLLLVRGHTGAVEALAYHPDGKRLATGAGDQTVRVWSAEYGSQLGTFRGHTAAVRAVAWSPDGGRLASASEDKTVCIWDAEADQRFREYRLENMDQPWIRPQASHVAISPTGNRLACLLSTGEGFVHDRQTGQVVFVWKDAGSTPSRGLAFSPDGKRLAHGFAGQVVLRDAATGSPLHTLPGHDRDVDKVAFSRDGRRLASASKDKTVKVWDLITG